MKRLRLLIAGSNKMSQLATCLQTARNFLLSQEEAKAIFESNSDN